MPVINSLHRQMTQDILSGLQYPELLKIEKNFLCNIWTIWWNSLEWNQRKRDSWNSSWCRNQVIQWFYSELMEENKLYLENFCGVISKPSKFGLEPLLAVKAPNVRNNYLHIVRLITSTYSSSTANETLGLVQTPYFSCAEPWSDTGATSDSDGAPCVEPKLSSTKVRRTLSNLTLLPHQTKTAAPNWFRRRSFAVLNFIS